MSKAQLPFFPKEITNITPSLSFRLEDEKVVYFNNGMPIFMHDKDDIDSFRMITAQFCETGNAKQCEIAKAFGVTEISVKRAVKLYREKGPRGFYKERKSRGPAVLTPAVLAEAQQLLDQDLLPADVAKQLGIKPDTLSKAIRDGRLRIRSKIENKTPVGEAGEVEPSTKSSRSAQDSAAPMGMGACAIEERLAASLGGALKAVTPSFQPVLDVPNGGLLLALPALLAIGLLTSTELFIAPKGYYGLDSLFMLLSFMALSRKKSIESLRYSAPGEWGKLLGLDRIPEVRTLRNKLHQLSNDNTPEVWSATLCRKWMEAAPEQAATLYVDGHVRVYNGHQTKLPRHYVARQKLCLRATTDYWVNAMDGQPFCVINQVVDPGLIEVIQQQILPRLQNDVPNQPSNNDLASNPLLHRFTLVFDREGYSPDLLKTMKDKRVACLSYHKYPGENWPEEEFKTHSVKLSNGQIVEMKLAERGTCLSNRLWVREVRKLTERGHQTAILATDYCSDLTRIAGAMFARWSQENFFKYARQHYDLDRLVDYGIDEISETVRVVNPIYRDLDKQVRSATGKISRLMAQFGAMNLEEVIEPDKVEAFLQKKSDLQEEIDLLQKNNKGLKVTRKATARHIAVNELPESERFKQLRTKNKHLIDTIKMIAYRAETAMASSLREILGHPDEARRLLQTIYTTETDIFPNVEAETITVRLHHLANASSDTAIQKLCKELNDTETLFPRTNLRLIFELRSSKN